MVFVSIFSIFISYTLTYKLVPKTINLGKKLFILDKPNERKQHKKPLVRIGGLAIAIGFYISFAIGFLFLNLTNINNQEIISLLLGLCAVFCLFLMGFADDIYQLSPWIRLSLQIIIATIAFNQGIYLEKLNLSFLNFDIANVQINYFVSYLITLFWLVGIPNAINWMDGLDGLAAGITAISSFTFLIINIQSNLTFLALISSCIFGCSLGFLIYNFYPAKLIMGDGGSNFLGSALAYLGILPLSNSYSNIPEINNLFHFYDPLLILAIPIFDMTIVVFSRLLKGNSPFFPDRSHIHHRLLNYGLSHKKTVIAILITHFFICFLCTLYLFTNDIYIA